MEPDPDPAANAQVQSGGAVTEAVRENIDSVSAIYEREEAKISGPQGFIEEITCHFGSPLYLGALIAFVALWLGANELAGVLHWHQFDPPPFSWLQGIIGINGVIISVSVLIRQNRMSRVAALRDHLHLQVNLLSEQKITKVIELLEELRRDFPDLENRLDPEVEAMRVPTNPHAMLNAIESQKD